MEPVDCGDTAHARLAICFQFTDLASLLAEATDPQEVVLLQSQQVALAHQLQELTKFETLQADKRMQQSLYQAMLSDFPEVDVLLGEEVGVAQANARRRGLAVQGNRGLRQEGRDGYYDDDRVDTDGSTELTAFMERVRLDEEYPRVECYICMEEVPQPHITSVGACGHDWCRACLTQMFDLASKSESDYPVRCCRDNTAIDMDEPAIVALIGTDLVSKLRAKILEYETKDKTYCCDPTCSVFIAPVTIKERLAKCPTCEKTTCAACKQEVHESADCGLAAGDKAFNDWRAANEAATCPSCQRVVIISYGCNHMSCRCKAEFCYECNTTWKKCECPIWNESRLYAHAAEVAERRNQPAAVEAVAAAIRLEVECRHTYWTRDRDLAGDHCDDCGWAAVSFLWSCDNCVRTVCTNCKRAADRW